MKIWTTLILLGCCFYNLLPAFSGNSGNVSRKQLLEAPGTVELSGQSVSFSAYLWRDFMPNSPKDGKPMRAAIKIFAEGKSPLKSNFKAEQIWVLKDKEIWNEKLQPSGRGLPPLGLTIYEVFAADGPKWSPGIKVNVIIQIKTEDGKKQLLRLSEQLIEKTM